MNTRYKAFYRGDPPTGPSVAVGFHQRGAYPSHHDALGTQTSPHLWLQLCFATRWHRSMRNALFSQYSVLSQSQIQATAKAFVLVVATDTYKVFQGRKGNNVFVQPEDGWLRNLPSSIPSPSCYLPVMAFLYFLPAVVIKCLCKAASQ